MNTPIRYTANPPRDISVRVYHDAAQSIANNAEVALAFNQERWDTHAQHDLSTNNTRLTCKAAGRYLITGNVSFESNGVGKRQLAIILNGTTTIGQTRAESLKSLPSETRVQVVTIYNLAVNDYVELRVQQNSGVSLNISVVANYSPEFMMIKVRG